MMSVIEVFLVVALLIIQIGGTIMWGDRRFHQGWKEGFRDGSVGADQAEEYDG